MKCILNLHFNKFKKVSEIIKQKEMNTNTIVVLICFKSAISIFLFFISA